MTDEDKLEGVLSRLLTPLVLKLAPGVSPAVQARIVGVLSHINKRVKDRAVVGLPVSDLLDNLRTAPAFTGNFLTIYVKMGLSRLSPASLSALLPRLLTFQSFPLHARELVCRAALLALPHAALCCSGAAAEGFSQLFTPAAAPSPDALSAAALLTQVLCCSVAPAAAGGNAQSNALVRQVIGAVRASLAAQRDMTFGLRPVPGAHAGVSERAASLVCAELDGTAATPDTLARRRRGVVALLSTPGLVQPPELALAIAVAGGPLLGTLPTHDPSFHTHALFTFRPSFAASQAAPTRTTRRALPARTSPSASATRATLTLRSL